MAAEQQYIDLYRECRKMICEHSAYTLNNIREQAFADFQRLGFPTQKQERYKYTDVAETYAPDYGLNLRHIDIPVDPYEVFRCDVPNLSTSLYFVVNDRFYDKALPHASLPEGVQVMSLAQAATKNPHFSCRSKCDLLI